MTEERSPICTECKHEEKHWVKLTYYPSSCRLEHRRHPVTGQMYHPVLCKDKNSHGQCTDFEQDSGAEGCLIFLGCLVVLLVVALLFFWWACS